MKKRAGMVASLTVSTMFMAGGIVAAQEPSQSPAHADEQHGRRASRGDDIAVHGHWMIEVRNPDGTLASHNEFENACVFCGDVVSQVLAKQASVAYWTLQLTGGGTSGPCTNSIGQPSQCYLIEPGSVDPGRENDIFPTLALTATGGTFSLAGNFAATANGQIIDVGSRVGTTLIAQTLFSFRALSTPIQIALGQRVYVTVTFSFS
jgi:hypothetical protein